MQSSLQQKLVVVVCIHGLQRSPHSVVSSVVVGERDTTRPKKKRRHREHQRSEHTCATLGAQAQEHGLAVLRVVARAVEGRGEQALPEIVTLLRVLQAGCRVHNFAANVLEMRFVHCHYSAHLQDPPHVPLRRSFPLTLRIGLVKLRLRRTCAASPECVLRAFDHLVWLQRHLEPYE